MDRGSNVAPLAVIALSLSLALFGLSACSNSSNNPPPETKGWSMITGSKANLAPGTVAGPGARERGTSWTDSSGRLWLFGGWGVDFSSSYGMLNDMWMFNTTVDGWSMISGSTGSNQAGTSTCPGGRSDSAAWADTSGHLWLFGGNGKTFDVNSGHLHDMWKFNTVSQDWTRLPVGDTLADQAGTTSCPGGRLGSAVWADTAGNMWLFGGNGHDFTGDSGMLSDLWKFTPNVGKTSGTWTLISGNTIVDQAGTATCPGGRSLAAFWTDPSGNFWLFGGEGFDFSNPAENVLNDLWKFTPNAGKTSGSWTLVTGSKLSAQAGTGTCPGSRYGSAAWADTAGKLWLFGGYGLDFSSSGTKSYLGDLWRFDPGTTTWSLIEGSNLANPMGTAGSPGGRFSGPEWTAPSGDFWLFGGEGWAFTGAGGDFLNDLWRYKR